MSKIDSAWNQPHINHYPFDFESNIFEKTTGELTDEGIIQYKIEEEDSEIKKLWEKVKEIGKDLKIQKDCAIDEEYILQNREQNEKLLECLNEILSINDSLAVILYNKGACLARLNVSVYLNDEAESLFRKAVKEKSDYVIGFRALSERVYSHIDSLMTKYTPEEVVRLDNEYSLFYGIAQQFENMSEKHWFFDDYWGMRIEDIF